MMLKTINIGKLRLWITGLFAVAFFVLSSMNLFAKDNKVDIVKLVQETSKTSQLANEIASIWWIPLEYWQASLELNPNMTTSQIEDFIKPLRPYTIILASDSKITASGKIKYKSRSIVEKSIQLIDREGTHYRPLKEKKIDKKTKNFLSNLKPVITNMIGPKGKYMYFFLFPSKSSTGQDIAMAKWEGGLSVILDKKEVNWRLPLASLLPEKICPVDGKKLNGEWKFCPLHGVELTPPSPVSEPPPKAPTATTNAIEISRITNDQAPQFWPRLSPDSTQLLYTMFDETRIEKKDRLSVRDIWAGASVVLMEIGKQGKKLVAGPSASGAAWYPDGTKFVYQDYKMEKPLLARTPAEGVGMTFISPSALGDYDEMPDVSPDGSRIAFNTSLGETTHLCTINSNGSNFTVCAEGSLPRWHPTKNLLAFVRTVGEKTQCFLFDTNSGQETQLTSGNADNSFPVWSPDGQWIAFLSDRDGKHHVYCMKRDGSQVVQLTTGGTNEGSIEWGHDGYLYFVSNAGAPTAKNKGWLLNFANIWRLKPILNE